MNGPTEEKPDYGNWVGIKFIYGPGLLGLAFLGLAFVFPLFLILAAFFILICAYFAYARFLFSSAGGNVQDKIWKLIPANLNWNGDGLALDIGCGNGPLTIGLAHAYPKARIAGTDFWGGSWEYSKAVCEKNARIEGVAERVTFQKASASALPFEDGHFDVVVSNLTFHEVGDSKDKRAVIREALRVLKKGGKFCLQDLFLIKRMYGETEDLITTIQSWGIKKAQFVNTSQAAFIPSALKLPFMVGTMGIICGEK